MTYTQEIFDQTTQAAILKKHYSKEKIEKLAYQRNPFFMSLRKDTSWGGTTYDHPVIYGNNENISSDISVVTAATGDATKSEVFLVTEGYQYGLASIAGRTYDANKNKADRFLDILDNAVEGTIKSMANRISVQLFRDGFGVVGQISSVTNASNSVITLVTADDAYNFYVGMTLVAAATATASAPHLNNAGTADASAYVISIDRSAGTLTMNTNVTAGGSYSSNPWIAADYLYVQGSPSATPQNKSIQGLGAWIPAAAPTSTSFFGVDRSKDTQALGGNRISAVGVPIREAIMAAGAQVAKIGEANPDTCWVGMNTFANISKELGDGARYVKFGSGEFGFDAISIYGPTGPIKVVPDRNCPENVGFLLDSSTWFLLSLGDAIRLDDRDSLRMRLNPTKDQLDLRFLSYAQLLCSAPGYNARITFA